MSRVLIRSKMNDKNLSAIPGGANGASLPLVADTDAAGAYQEFEMLRQDDAGTWVPVDFTPVAPPTPTPPTPTPGPPIGLDAFDLSQAVVASPDCPSSVAQLPIISAFGAIELIDVPDITTKSVTLTFNGRDSWPDVVPPGWDGVINHTLWMCESIGGVWYTLPIQECWHDYCPAGGILIPGQIPTNFTYYADPPMKGFQPPPNSQVGFYATTGDTRRMNEQPAGVAGRTNVVRVPFAAGLYTFTAGQRRAK